jgi:hypothetical protein
MSDLQNSLDQYQPPEKIAPNPTGHVRLSYFWMLQDWPA